MSLNIDPSQWRLRTPNDIRYKLLEGFPIGSFASEGATAVEEYIIQSSDLLAFAVEAFPLPFTVADTGLLYPQRRRLPGLSSLVAKKVSYESWDVGKPIDPFSIDTEAASGTYGDFIRVTIEYGTTQENDEERDPGDPKTFLEISTNASGEFLTDDSSKGKWLPSNDEVNIPTPRKVVEPTTEWTARWTQIPYDYFTNQLITRIRDKLGKVNSGAMSTLYDAPADTVLFMGWGRHQQFTWRTDNSGQPPMTVEFKFIEKNFKASDGTKVTHQKVYRPAKGTWQTMLIDDKPLYGSTDLDELFTGIE